jgi:hypothetical protein
MLKLIASQVLMSKQGFPIHTDPQVQFRIVALMNVGSLTKS